MKECAVCGDKCVNEICSPKCCLVIWEKTKPKNKANARRVARMIGLRSIGEVKFAATLDEAGVLYTYEPDSFKYVPPPQKYTPDFRIKKRKRSGGYMYLEYKGNLKGSDRRKLLLVKAQHKDLDIRLVFEKPLNKINKQSNTTYAAWCEQHEFPWAEKELPKEWLKE